MSFSILAHVQGVSNLSENKFVFALTNTAEKITSGVSFEVEFDKNYSNPWSVKVFEIQGHESGLGFFSQREKEFYQQLSSAFSSLLNGFHGQVNGFDIPLSLNEVDTLLSAVVSFEYIKVDNKPKLFLRHMGNLRGLIAESNFFKEYHNSLGHDFVKMSESWMYPNMAQNAPAPQTLN